MLLKEAADIVRWLCKSWSGFVDWDQYNLSKLEKHGFSKAEVEIVLAMDFVFAGEVVGESEERRFVLYGKLDDGRYMTIAWTIRGERLRPISCRRSRDAEKKQFDQSQL